MTTIYERIQKAPDQMSKMNIFEKNLDKLLLEDIPIDSSLFLLLECIKMYKNEKYEFCINEIMKYELTISGINREYDWIISLLVKICYKSMKKLNKFDFRLFCSLLITNKKYLNRRASLALTNIILKILIDKKMFKYARNYFNSDFEYDGLYNLYKGIIECISMNYEIALKCFKTASLLSNKHKTKIEKYKVITLLLLGKLSSSYDWNKQLFAYKEACEAVKLGDREKLVSIINEYKNVFWEDKTYFLIRRFHHLILHECIRKISIVYSRISLKEIEKKFNISKSLFEHFVFKNKINGVIQKDVFYSVISQKSPNEIDLINTTSLNERILDNMTYPEIKKINYENYVPESARNVK
ncbi:26S proteasome regulatory complex, subunit RPN3/PSMD3 [Pseudoloma neurophilia]|uniref:26S proteasome regulatory complex, subunit RPN3/PSMD3 n=1 Tax=Pseudoloma neurophilia TaxID=146866 RepID=A0A0R0M095_9MICR|nr:26S proteasome regulatory complex, subunit RPN3/PSMD3 [Pseudoloma neurophilia]